MNIDENQNVHNLPVPNIEAMREHLEHLFGEYLDGFQNGLVELAWTDTSISPDKDGKLPLSKGRQYGTDQLEDMAQEAFRLNSKPQCNVYVGASLRKPGTFPGGRASDADVLAMPAEYADLDDEGSVAKAVPLYAKGKPTLVVVTGRAPYTRAQCWWRLEEPITDQDVMRAAMSGIATKLGGDHTVVNPSRVMRLAGSIAWPMKKNRQVELTHIVRLKEPGQSAYMAEHLAKIFPYDDAWTASAASVSAKRAYTGADFDDFGNLRNGREDKMHRMVWAIILKWHRAVSAKPSADESYKRAKEEYDVYERGTRPQGGHPANLTLTQVLDLEGRGWAVWWVKWRQSMRQWDTKVAEWAKREPRQPADNADRQPIAGPLPPLILTGAEFLSAFRPPDYLVDGVMQRSGLYAMTARTGHGKTAVAMHAALCVARGVPFHSKPTEQGSVLFFAGENSDDIRARYTVMLDIEKANVSDVPLYFIDGVINIQADMERIRTDAAAIPNLSMVIIDTKQAYFLGDDGNSNEQQVQFARLGRELIKLPGHPAVVFLCHPIKNAGRDNLVPMGGSAFLNEIDFNFTLWAEDKVCKLNPHPDKWRGPAFEEMAFELRQQNSAQLKDSKDREIPSVVAIPISEMAAERREAVAGEDEKQMLRLMHADKNASFVKLAERAGWKQPNGEFAKSRVARVVARLLESKFVYRFHGLKYRLTKKGCKHIGVSFKGDDDDE